MNNALSVPEPPPCPPPQPANKSNPVPAAPNSRNSRRLSFLRSLSSSLMLMPVHSLLYILFHAQGQENSLYEQHLRQNARHLPPPLDDTEAPRKERSTPWVLPRASLSSEPLRLSFLHPIL